MLVCLAPSLFGSAGRGPFPRIIPSRRCHPTAVSAPAKPQPIVPQPGMVRRSRYKCHYSGPSPLGAFQARQAGPLVLSPKSPMLMRCQDTITPYHTLAATGLSF